MATQTYATWEAVKEAVAAGLHVTAAQLDARWDSICARAAKDAAAEIKRVFILKGYTAAQVAASDDARTYNEMLGAFFAFTRGSALATYDLKSVEHLDCRKVMAEAGALVIGDVAVAPASSGSDVGGVAAGQNEAARGFLDPGGEGAWGVGSAEGPPW
jgi:hypothetical protein